MKHQSTLTVAQIHLSHACWVPQYLQSENEEMNKTCIQSLTHTHTSTQTLWHFFSSEIMQKKNPNKQHKENSFVLHKFCYGKEDLYTRKIFVHAAGTELFEKSTEALTKAFVSSFT